MLGAIVGFGRLAGLFSLGCCYLILWFRFVGVV